MAQDIFLQLHGIVGESKDSQYPEHIEVLNWSWSIAQQSTMHTGSGGGTGKATVGDLVFEHYVDRSSPTLMKHCLSGKHIESACLLVRKVGGDKPLTFLKLTMTDVIVTSFNPVGHREDDVGIRERVSLSFAKVDSAYTVQNQQGGSGGTVGAGYDIQRNTKA